MTETAFGFTKFVVADLDRAERFYRDVFAMRVLHRVRSEEHAYPLEEVIMAADSGEGGHRLLLVRYLDRPSPPAGAAWAGFTVPDIVATLAAIEASDGRIEVPIHENAEHGVLGAIATDPDGHLIEAIQILAAD